MQPRVDIASGGPQSPPSRTRVLIVDDSYFQRRILRLLLEDSCEFEVAGEAEDGEQGLSRWAELRPDVMTVDIDMPVLNGLDMLARLREQSMVPVIIVTALPMLLRDRTYNLDDLRVSDVVVKTFSDNPLDLSVFAEELLSSLRVAIQAREKTSNN